MFSRINEVVFRKTGSYLSLAQENLINSQINNYLINITKYITNKDILKQRMTKDLPELIAETLS